MALNIFQEISRRSVIINKYEDIFMVWCNSYLTLHADRTIRIFEFSHNIQCTDRKIDCIEYTIKAPVTSTASGLFKHLSRGVGGMDLAQMTMNPALWPHSKNLLHEMCDVTALEWSPEGMLWNNDYVLAVLSNVGHVEFYKKQRKSWVVALNVSELIAKIFKEVFDKHLQNIEIITKCAYALETSAMCWAPDVNHDKSATFVTAQKDGTILFWSIQEQELNIEAELIFKISTDFKDIIKMLWIPKGPKVLLLCSNTEGQIFLVECHKSEKKRLVYKNSHMLWGHKDRMVAKYFNFVIEEDKIIYICNKHRHLLVQMLSEDCGVLSESVKNINDHKISGLTKHENTFYMTTVNGHMYKINYSISNNDTLDIQYHLINIKDLSSCCELQSCCFSRNGALLTLGMINRRILYRKENMKLDIVYYTIADSDFPEFTLLLNNPMKKIYNCWDCVETLRYKIVKGRRFPEYNYNQLLSEGESDVYKLKVYLIILMICKVLEENFKINKGTLTENSVELIKEKIAIVHAKTMISNLYDRYITNNILTDFEMQCFAGGKKYLEIITKKLNIGLDIPNKILNLVNKDYDYICQSCDKMLIGYACEDCHLNSFCSLTFTPIEIDDYLICKGCGAIARTELSKENPICIYCDLFFEQTFVNKIRHAISYNRVLLYCLTQKEQVATQSSV